MNAPVFLVVLFLFASIFPASGQGSLTTARQAYESYLIQRDTCPATEVLLQAKDAIDPLITPLQTNNELETLVYQAAIYSALANATDTSTANLLIIQAESARNKARKLDRENRYLGVLNEVDNSFFRFYIHKGRQEFDLHQYGAAYHSFDKASAFKDYPSALYLAGWIAKHRKDYDVAIAKYNKALENDTPDREILNQLLVLYALKGDSAAKLQDYGEAEAFYKKALEIDSSYDRAVVSLSEMLLKQAMTLYQKASDMKPIKQQMVIKYEALIELDRAFPYLEKAVAINPRSVNALQNMITYHTLKNDPKKADEWQRKIDAL